MTRRCVEGCPTEVQLWGILRKELIYTLGIMPAMTDRLWQSYAHGGLRVILRNYTRLKLARLEDLKHE